MKLAALGLLAMTPALCATACGGGSQTVASTESGEEEEILRLAEADLGCPREQIELRVTGEGDSSTGETVPIRRAYGCDAGASYHCDRDGCQRDGEVWRCGERLVIEHPSDDGRVENDRDRYDFDDVDCDPTSVRVPAE